MLKKILASLEPAAAFLAAELVIAIWKLLFEDEDR